MYDGVAFATLEYALPWTDAVHFTISPAVSSNASVCICASAIW